MSRFFLCLCNQVKKNLTINRNQNEDETKKKKRRITKAIELNQIEFVSVIVMSLRLPLVDRFICSSKEQRKQNTSHLFLGVSSKKNLFLTHIKENHRLMIEWCWRNSIAWFLVYRFLFRIHSKIRTWKHWIKSNDDK